MSGSSRDDHRPLLSILLLMLLGSCVCIANAMFLSIDCGGSDSYTDDNSIKWVGDEDYVSGGESKSVGNFVSRELDNVRVFSSPGKNCYTVPVKTGDRILVRATFYYGSFDGGDTPPVFNLYFDDTRWAKVNITESSSFVNFYEVIYTVKKSSTSICLAQTFPSQLPFISSLEFRTLAPTMYNRLGSGYALFGVERLAFGASKTIRYPDDPYDRKWNPGTSILFAKDVQGEASKIDVSTGAEDFPPAAALQNASVANTLNTYYDLSNFLPNYEALVYITTFFSEVEANSKRSFRVYVDDKAYSKVIVPPFGGVVEVPITNVVTSSTTSITIKLTSDSTLPVLINAFEVYTAIKLSSDDNSDAPPAERPPVAETPPTETPPVAETPPTETPPVAETPPTETPPVAETPPTETPPVAETPPIETPPSFDTPTPFPTSSGTNNRVVVPLLSLILGAIVSTL